MLLAAEPLAAVLEPAVPSGGRLGSSEGNWNGRDTGTRLPSRPPKPKEEGKVRAEGEGGAPSRLPGPVVETCGN